MTHKQMALATQLDAGFEQHRKATRWYAFLAEMHKVVPRAGLCAEIERFYPKERAEGGRRPIGLERMLRIRFLQQWYMLSDTVLAQSRDCPLFGSSAEPALTLPQVTEYLERQRFATPTWVSRISASGSNHDRRQHPGFDALPGVHRLREVRIGV